MNGKIRIGYSRDTHILVEGRDLFLGGIKIPFEKGLLGHSDADVLLHAIAEAILGALALGDLGTHFPDNDPKYKGIDSKILLKEVVQMMKNKGYKIGNVDTMLILELPKMKPHILEIRESIAGLLETSVDNISVKATTNEKMGYLGENKAIEANAVVLLESGE
jgi:2-C-methyl-D-erythritol 2,4-cyclodiphosphate synthase